MGPKLKIVQQVYFDTASAEPLHPAARDVLVAAYERGYADPRRLHRPGREARLLLDNAREVVAESLGARRDEVIFTSSGTAAVQAGVLGLLPPDPSGIAVAPVEHQAVLEAAAWAGVETIDLTVDATGRIDVPLDRPAASVVAVQHANHEVGTIQPVTSIADACGSVPVFMDACASMGRIPLPAGWAAAAGSARKWGGPGGVGVLVVRRNASWRWPLPGDPHSREDHGFSNVPGALAAAAALQAVVAERAETAARQFDLITRIRLAVASIEGVDVVGDPVDRLPHLVTFSFLYVDGEALVTALDRLGFAVASGSACAVDSREPSRVLAAMGALTHGNVRLSLTREVTAEEVERFLRALPGVVADLRAEVTL